MSLTNFTRWKFAPVIGVWPSDGFHEAHGRPSSSGRPSVLNGFLSKPAAVAAAPAPCDIARSARGPLNDSRIMCVWSSNTNRSRGTAPWACADPISSSGSTSKNLPNTSFIAMNAAAIPPEEARKRRRLMPSLRLASPAISAMRASTWRCCSVCGNGRYSPFDTTCVGIGERSSSASSARANPESWESDSQESSSREPGRRFGIGPSSQGERAIRSASFQRSASPPQSQPRASSAVSETVADSAADHALKMLGKPYHFGGSTPAGLDCSGLVQFSFRQAGLALPHNTDKQRSASLPVRLADLRRGDLLFFDQEGKKSSHVGIYVGAGKFVHAPSSGKYVRSDRLDSPYWKKHLSGARRLFV